MFYFRLGDFIKFYELKNTHFKLEFVYIPKKNIEFLNKPSRYNVSLALKSSLYVIAISKN